MENAIDRHFYLISQLVALNTWGQFPNSQSMMELRTVQSRGKAGGESKREKVSNLSSLGFGLSTLACRVRGSCEICCSSFSAILRDRKRIFFTCFNSNSLSVPARNTLLRSCWGSLETGHVNL